MGWIGLVCLVKYVWFCLVRFGLVGFVQYILFGRFGKVGLVCLIWQVWFGRIGMKCLEKR